MYRFDVLLICPILLLASGLDCMAGDDEDLTAVLNTFGPGAITQTSDAAKPETVAEFIASDFGKRTFSIVSGDQSGGTLIFEVEEKPGDQGVRFVHIGDGDIATIQLVKSDVYRSQQVDSDSNSVAIFEPAEPVFLASQGFDTAVESEISVKVSPVSDPTQVVHQGNLKCSYEVLGAFRVNAPAGNFDTICVRTRYQGKVGPADVDDSRYIFYAKKYGPVAIRTFSHVEAMIFYNKTKQRSLLLASYQLVPDPPVPGK
ncbi:MAG: hypothetical protein VX641_01585 [Planctomycetota bacterium]|nr:hypothetical protein [Planctomycetota bacterium]